MTEEPSRAGVPSAAPADDAEDDRWCMAVRLLGRIEQRLDTALRRRHGLPLSEYRALCALSRAGTGSRGLRMGELAERIGLKDSSVTRLIARLEAQQLAERLAAPARAARGDGRMVTAAITGPGRRRYAEARPTYLAALGAELESARSSPYLADLAAWVRTDAPEAAEGVRDG